MTLDQSTYHGLYDSEESTATLREALAGGRVPVAVYGLGKMGLPLAAVFAERTGNVTGVDVDPDVAAAVDGGDCHVTGEPGLAAAVEQTAETGALEATTDGVAAAEAATLHVIIVPTLVDEDGTPDLSALEAVAETIAAGLSPGDLVVVESTVPPGTTRDVVWPILRDGDVAAEDFGLAFCPERTASGSALEDIRGSYPKVVGGVDAESTRAARAVYGTVTDNDVVTVADATTAECVKVFEGVYRDVNIALANELAGLADELDVDVLEAIEVANTQPYCDIHTPGAGVGGHCIPIYPHFLIGGCETDTPLLERARAVNDDMPGFVVDRLAEGLDRRDTDVADARVAVLGVTYRPGIDDIRESPAIPIAAQLQARGAEVFAVDPVCSTMEAVPAEPVGIGDLPDLDLDGVVLATAHDQFTDVDWATFDPLVVVDGRQMLSDTGQEHLVYTVGEGFTSGPAAPEH